MASAGTVTIDFAAETAKFQAELKQVNARLKSMDDGFKSFGSTAKLALGLFTSGAAITSLISFGKAAFAAADAIGDAAAKFGTTAESLSRLKFAAEQSDVEFQSLTIGIKTVQKAISEAANGSDAAIEKFSQLGLSATALRELSLEDQFKTLAQAFKDIKSPADQTRIAMELFGKAGADLVPLLNEGAGGIDKLMRKADELGITLKNNTAVAIDAADKALKQFKATAQGFTANFLGGLALDLGLVELSEPIDLLQVKLRDLEKQRDRLLVPGVGLFTDSVLLPRVEEEIDRVKQKLIDLQRLVSGGSAVASGPNSRNFRFNEAEPKKLSASELAAMKQANELRLKEEQAFADAKFFVNQMVNEKLFQSQIDGAALFSLLEAEKTDFVVQGEAERQQQIQSSANAQKASAKDVVDFSMQQYGRDAQAKQSALTAVGGALQLFAGKSKALAIASFLVNQRTAIAEALANTHVGGTKALAQGGIWGYVQLAAILAAGYAQVSQIRSIKADGSGGTGGGGPISLGGSVNPIYTGGNDAAQQGASGQSAVQVYIQGNYGWDEYINNKVIEGIREAVDARDVVIISPGSRQAQELMPT